MKMFRISISIVALSVMIIVSTACSKDPASTIIIHGSTTMEPILKQIAEEYLKNNDVNLTIKGIGSESGIKSLLKKSCDIAVTSREISPKEKRDLKKKGLILKEFLIGYDAIVPIIHPKNPLKGLFLGQIGDIYKGFITDWKEFDSTPGKIEPVKRDALSGTNRFWQTRVMSSDPYKNDVIEKKSNSEILAYVAHHKNAIGYISKSFVNNEVKVLIVNNRPATVERILNKQYPIVRKLYIYGREESIKESVKSFIVYILSGKGKKILNENKIVSALEKI